MKSNFRLFKKHWKEEKNSKLNFELYDLSKLLNLRSKSIIKRILVISIIEFCFSIISIIILNQKNIGHDDTLIIFLNYLYYFILIYYFIKFWINFKRINLNLNLKKLFELILQTKKHVYEYVSLNIILFNLNVIVLFFQYYKRDNVKIISDKYFGESLFFSQIFAYTLIIILSSIISFIIWTIYRMFYLRMVDRLCQNLKELND